MVKTIMLPLVFCLCTSAVSCAPVAQTEKSASSPEVAAESAEVAQKTFDYSCMLELSQDKANLRMPAPEEIKALGPLWPTVPPEENAAYYYALAASLVRTGTPMGAVSSADPFAGDKAAFAVWIRDNGPALDAVKKSLACKVCEFPPLFDRATNRMGTGVELLASLRHLGWTISDAAFLEELNNRPEAVVSWDLANIRMGRQMMGHGALVQNLVGTAIESIGILGLDRLIANTELPAPTLQRIVEKAREAESSREVMRDILAREELYLAGEKGGDLERAQQFAREIRRSMDIPLHVYLAEEAVRKSLELDLDFGTPMRVAEWANARRNFGTMDAQLRVLQIRAAIAIFQQQAGRLPEKLDELVPAILPSIPLDPFSGKPLRYARTDDGWKVWSVGFDLKDHGGMINSASRFTTWTEGSDAVFPSKLPNTLQWRARRSGASVPKPQRDATGDLLGLTPLHYAANRGDAAEVARLLAAGADVNAKGNCGQTPLHLAATAAVANLLLEHGADLNAMSDFTTTFNIFRAPGTPLGWAIFGDRRDVVEVLLDANATRDFPGNSNALESAVGLDRNEIVTMLIKKGEKINEALHYAVGSGNIAMAGKLISAGAMVGAQELSKAIEERDWDMAEFCLAKGGKLDIFSASALGKLKEAETLIADDPSLVKQADAKKWTALHWAAFAGQKQIVAFLVSKGADVNQKESGETPLQVAIANAMWPWQGGNLIAARHGEKGKALDAEGTFRELLDCGADVDARNAYGQTPLIVAVYQMNPTAAEALIKKGADVNIKDDSGKTALDYAKETEKDGPADSMTKLLESHGAK